VAIISNAQTPYRLHLHRRIAREIPEIQLWSVFTHETSNAPWAFADPQEIGPVSFGKGESSDDQPKPSRAPREWRRAGRIIKWMRSQNVRFVVMMGYNDAGRVRIIRWCRKNGIPCWLFGDSNILCDHESGMKATLKRILVGQVVQWCDGILSCGTLGRDYFAKYGADPNRCFYFPYEPDYDLIQSQTPQEIEAVRQRFDLDPARRRIVFSGRLTRVKRADLLIDAFAALAAARPDWDLLVIGDGELKESLATRLGPALACRSKWTGFLDDQATVGALYRLSDVLVLPSDHEPWALVINEAAAAGLAIVSSHVVGASAELVRDGINGRIFAAGDLKGLTDCLLDVASPAKTDAMKAASAQILSDWRRRGDPVAGLRNALAASGILHAKGA
jgi:glycosyltransferase involved in cell wall biosynthesis